MKSGLRERFCRFCLTNKTPVVLRRLVVGTIVRVLPRQHNSTSDTPPACRRESHELSLSYSSGGALPGQDSVTLLWGAPLLPAGARRVSGDDGGKMFLVKIMLIKMFAGEVDAVTSVGPKAVNHSNLPGR